MTEHQTVTIDTAKPLILPDAQTVTELEHYTDNLFRFCVTRPASMRFKSGEFLMIGLIGEPHPETGRQKPLLREPETYERFDRVILTHTCRNVADLKFGEELITETLRDPLVGEDANEKLRYYPTTTQEKSYNMGRITNILEDGTLFLDLDIINFNPTNDRAMVCGSMGLNTDIKRVLGAYGLTRGSNSNPGEFVVEKAFVG